MNFSCTIGEKSSQYSSTLEDMAKCKTDSEDESPQRKRQKMTTGRVPEKETQVIQSAEDLRSLLAFQQDAGPVVRQSKIRLALLLLVKELIMSQKSIPLVYSFIQSLVKAIVMVDKRGVNCFSTTCASNHLEMEQIPLAISQMLLRLGNSLLSPMLKVPYPQLSAFLHCFSILFQILLNFENMAIFFAIICCSKIN